MILLDKFTESKTRASTIQCPGKSKNTNYKIKILQCTSWSHLARQLPVFQTEIMRRSGDITNKNIHVWSKNIILCCCQFGSLEFPQISNFLLPSKKIIQYISTVIKIDRYSLISCIILIWYKENLLYSPLRYSVLRSRKSFAICLLDGGIGFNCSTCGSSGNAAERASSISSSASRVWI